MDLGTSFNPAVRNTDVAEYYDEAMKRWDCWGCSRPTRVIYYPTRAIPKVFNCPVNRYAPLSTNNCASFDPIPGYEELWE